MGEVKEIINYFNRLNDGYEFTSKSMLSGLTNKGVKRTTITSTLNTFYKMGAVEKEKIQNPGKGPRLKFIKIRTINPVEKKSMTTWPDCVEFSKKLRSKTKKQVTTKSPRPPRKTKKAKKVTVKKHTRLIKTENKRVTIVEKDDRTIVTIFK